MKVRRTKTFDKTFIKLPERIQIKAEKAIKLLIQDFFTPHYIQKR